VRIFWRGLIEKKGGKERRPAWRAANKVSAPTVTAVRRLAVARWSRCGAARRSGCGRGGDSSDGDVGGNGDDGSGGGDGGGAMVMVAVVHRSKYIGWR